MTYNFPYLKDSAFLKKFDQIKLKQQFVKIVVLSFDERPVAEIQGRVTGGNFTLNGDSAMRRTGNLNLVANDYENNITSVQHLLSINKKIQVLIGFTNTTEEYTDYPILWFPQGTYVIINPNITHDANGINIALTIHDKMALLNGECGGVLPASVIFSEVEDIDENGQRYITRPTIYRIIQELVNHFGGEQLGKIIISDIDNKIKKVMKWTGSVPLYRYHEIKDGKEENYYGTTLTEEQRQAQAQGKGTITEFLYGDDIGYILDDFTYPGDLIGNAGDSIVTILDKIKSVLGNYEYFYDIQGNFRFQEIKNYLNVSYSTFKINEINASNYLVDYASGKSVYTFEDANIIMAYTNTPQYQQIKNDFVVWGKRESVDGKQIPIRYHLAIDNKPFIGNTYKVFFSIDPDDGIMKAKKPIEFEDKTAFPQTGDAASYYLDINQNKIYKWNPVTLEYNETSYTIEQIKTNDYRTQLYLSGVNSQPFGLNSNYYYTELKNEWPKLYNIQGQQDQEEQQPSFFPQVIKHPSDIDYFLDFIDTSSAISQLSVNNIGRRTLVINDDSINCIFEPDNPDVVIIQAGVSTTKQIRDDCEIRKQAYTQVGSDIYDLLMDGGALRSAYEEIRKELYQYTSYNEQVSITTLPIYYLEPNVRITIRDNETNIYGDYMIKSISLPLDVNGTMNISCTRALERI